MRDWSELPYDVIEMITGSLQLQDYHRFAVVCRAWSYVASKKHHSPARKLPWLLIYDDKRTTQRFLSFSEKKFYHVDIPQVRHKCCCGSSYGFLVTIDYKLEVQFLDPFSGAQIPLPHLPPYVKVPLPVDVNVPNKKLRNNYLARVVLSADPRRTSDYVVMAIYGKFKSLAFWRPGDAVWTIVNQEPNDCIQDVTWYKGAFYAVTGNNFVFVIDIGANPEVRLVMPKYEKFLGATVRYLVEVKGRLYYVARGVNVTRDSCKTHAFAVAMIDFKQQKWHFVNSLRGIALFLGYSASLSVEVHGFPGLEGDCIYFAHDGVAHRRHRYCEDQGVYDYYHCENTTTFFYPSNADVSILRLKYAPVWLTPSPW